MVVIVDYDAGNLRSVQRACHKVGVEAAISADPDTVRRAERVIFPGVGAAGSAMASLEASGMDAALREAVAAGKPVFGICLGLQISLERSEENEQTTLGLLSGEVVRFRPSSAELKVPHMGWNEVRVQRPHHMLAGIEPGDEFYFVHSYYPRPAQLQDVFATTEYEVEFASAVARDSYFATQFHPEKSGRVGLRMLAQFATWDGSC